MRDTDPDTEEDVEMSRIEDLNKTLAELLSSSGDIEACAVDIETIAPQHGAMLSGRRNVERFIDWAASLPCGTDLIPA